MIDDIQKRAIELCLAVYRITDKFPEHEILGKKIRGVSIDIIEFLAYNSTSSTNSSRVFDYKGLEKIIQIFERYCDIAQEQKWVREENFQILKGEYRRLYKSLELAMSTSDNKGIKGKKSNSRVAEKSKAERYDLSKRQEKIIKFLDKSTEGATMEDLARALAVSKKTVERHMSPLVRKKIISREGNTRSTKFFNRI